MQLFRCAWQVDPGHEALIANPFSEAPRTGLLQLVYVQLILLNPVVNVGGFAVGGFAVRKQAASPVPWIATAAPLPLWRAGGSLSQGYHGFVGDTDWWAATMGLLSCRS